MYVKCVYQDMLDGIERKKNNLEHSRTFYLYFIGSRVWLSAVSVENCIMCRLKDLVVHRAHDIFWNKHFLSSWWRHQMETFSALLAFVRGIHMTRSFDVYFGLRLNKQLSKQWLLRPKTRCCPMTGHRLSEGWPPHIGRPISVRRPTNDQSSYSTNSQPKTIRSDQSDLISGWRLTATKNCLWKRTLRNLNNVMCKICFCDYHWLPMYKDFSIWKSIMGWIIENFRRIGRGLNGVVTNFDEYFCGILSNHYC